MILLVDVGNSRIKWAVPQEGRLGDAVQLRHTEPDWPSRLAEAWAPLPGVERIVVSCVSGEAVRSTLAQLAGQRWGLTPEWVVAAHSGWGVRNAYAEPERLGPDRWSALVAARSVIDGPVCVVDCGTAVTLDVLHGDGRHLGGWILPGLSMMRRALSEQTDGLSLVEARDELAHGLGSDTAACILQGTRAAVVGAVERGLREAEAAIGIRPACLLTGGDAEALLGPLNALTMPAAPVLVPQLVLQGLARIAGLDIGPTAGAGT